MTDSEYIKTIVDLEANCQQGQALHWVLGMLVQADMDDHILDSSDEEENYDLISIAKTNLFLLACAYAERMRRLHETR